MAYTRNFGVLEVSVVTDKPQNDPDGITVLGDRNPNLDSKIYAGLLAADRTGSTAFHMSVDPSSRPEAANQIASAVSRYLDNFAGRSSVKKIVYHIKEDNGRFIDELVENLNAIPSNTN